MPSALLRLFPMKLNIRIPCYNEEGMLSQALGALPRNVAGFDSVEWLVINDGSRNRTVLGRFVSTCNTWSDK